MKKVILLTFAMVIMSVHGLLAQCCDVISGGIPVITTNGICVVNKADGSNCEPDADGDGVADSEDTCPDVVGLESLGGCPDTDGDGITDAEDDCPTVAGISSLNGCADSDGDGIADKNDSCPEVAGISSLGGCPDSDGDGIADKNDACPNVAGVKETKGCPEPDTDDDGVLDKDDKCPEVAGIIANKGCPEIDEEVKTVLKEALEGVQFRSGSSILLNSSYPKLDKVVEVMSSHPEFKLEISGYTDNTGNADSNLKLSQDRAHAAEKYIVDKGIEASRISAEGYGIADPIADNSTPAGRAKNRRVEFKVDF